MIRTIRTSVACGALAFIVLTGITACDTLAPDPPNLTAYTFEAEMTVKALMSCNLARDTPNGFQNTTVISGGEVDALSGTVGPGFGARVTCTGETDSGTLRVELYADGDLVDSAETTTPSDGAVVEHSSPIE